MSPEAERLLSQVPGVQKVRMARGEMAFRGLAIASASYSGKLEGKQYKLWLPKCWQNQQENLFMLTFVKII